MNILKFLGVVLIIAALIVGLIGILYLNGFNEVYLVGGDAYNFMIGREYGIGFIVIAGFLFLSGVIVLAIDIIDTDLMAIKNEIKKQSQKELSAENPD